MLSWLSLRYVDATEIGRVFGYLGDSMRRHEASRDTCLPTAPPVGHLLNDEHLLPRLGNHQYCMLAMDEGSRSHGN